MTGFKSSLKAEPVLSKTNHQATLKGPGSVSSIVSKKKTRFGGRHAPPNTFYEEVVSVWIEHRNSGLKPHTTCHYTIKCIFSNTMIFV